MRYYSILGANKLHDLKNEVPLPGVLWTQHLDNLTKAPREARHQLIKQLGRKNLPYYLVTIDLPDDWNLKRFFIDTPDWRYTKRAIPILSIVSTEPYNIPL